MARVISAVIFLPVLISVIWLLPSPIYFSALVSIAIVLGLHEYYALTEKVGAQASRVLGFPAAAAILAAFYLKNFEMIVAALALLIIVELMWQLFTNRDLRATVLASAATIFGVGYLAVLGGYLIAIRMIQSPIEKLSGKLLLFFFALIFAGDTGAYYVGRSLGKHKLAPTISPGKTIEGAIGGLISNVLAVLLAHYTFFPELKLTEGIVLALVMGAIGQVGDLCESMLKRGAGAKDAGQIIPGHGGVLDRLDSLLFNAPVLYYYYVFFMK